MSSGGSNRFLGTDELADMFGVPVSTIRNEWKAWGLPGVKIGRYVKFRERNVEAWIDARTAEEH
jgi:excisionase family DNA binding protein